MKPAIETTPVATVTGLYRATFSGLEPLTVNNPLTLEEAWQNPVFYEMELYPEQQDANLIVDLIYDTMAPIRLQDLIRGTDIPRGIRFWPDWFDIPLFRIMHDASSRRVYPRSPGIHTVRIRMAKRNRDRNVRDYSPANGGSTSPVFEFAIAAGSEWSSEYHDEETRDLQARDWRRSSGLRPDASAIIEGEETADDGQ
jgi:hypothetical protein